MAVRFFGQFLIDQGEVDADQVRIALDLMEDENSVVLAVPIAGPGFGSSRFAVVRVGESPGSLKQRLLANTMVIGRCVDEVSWETLRLMTVADGRAKIVDCGELDSS